MRNHYTLEYVDGRVQDIAASDDAAAERSALARFDGDAVAADTWDDAGETDDGERQQRLLIWASAVDAENDDGAHAVAQLCVRRERVQ